jgi:hypothetical protein
MMFGRSAAETTIAVNTNSADDVKPIVFIFSDKPMDLLTKYFKRIKIENFIFKTFLPFVEDNF